ncbi:MAG: CHAT domain-containing protein [Sterolibacterium sp.]|nr:CHAT domain-containing protein [Sterolibacterium sp.]MBP9798981.1 CHAT domain-containing protein [Sterolibacterium sp.]
MNRKIHLSSSGFAAVLRAGFLALTLTAATFAHADSSSQQFEFAASGRFDELQKLIEAEETKHPLNTRDRHALCYAYSKTKRYNKLLPCLDKLAENVKKGDLRTRLFGLDDATPTIHILRADAYIELGQYAKAIEEAQKGLKWLRDEDSDDLDMVVQSLAALSLASTLSGNRNDGERYAKELARTNTSLLGHSDYANARAMALGRVYMALGDYPRALEGIRSDSTFKLKAFLDNLVSGALFRGVSNWAWAELPRGFMINKALLETGQIDQARAGFDELLNIPQVKENGEIYWLILNDRARIAEQDNDRERAVRLYKEAIDIIESQRSSINTEANKIGFVGDKQAVYGRLIAVLYQLNQPAEAYEYIERAKARALVDLLANKEDFAIPPLAAKQAAPLLASYRAAENDALVQMPLDLAAGTKSGQRNLVVKKGAELNSVAPELASLVSVTSIPLKEILSHLSKNEAIIEYFFHDKSLYAIVLSEAGVRAARIDGQKLEEQIRNFRAEIDQRGEDVGRQSHALYNQLIRPLEADIKGRDLLIVPHGALHYLPFAALHDGQNFLLAHHSLRYLPSASVLKYLKPSRKEKPESVLVFGNPDLGDPKYDLPNAEVEAKTIADLLPGSELLVRKKASEVAFKQFAPSFRYLHIASHGQFNAANALDSRLLLSPEAGQDGSLTVGELYGIQMDVDLTTLSACETGLGKVLSGDDVVGLTRGFLYAGSSSVVASLWEVDDLATSELMKAFYGRLKNGVPKKLALREAQMEVRKSFPHPFFWAAFFITGQGR